LLFRNKIKPLSVSFEASVAQTTLDALMCGAVGDALGAGIEKWELADIIDHFKEVHHINYTREERLNKPRTNGQAGDVTDDTAMTLCVMSALIKAMQDYLDKSNNAKFQADKFTKCALQHMHQAFLYWAQSQHTYSGLDGSPCKAFIKDNKWPHLNAFNNTFGAGTGTINVLMQGVQGSLAHPPISVAVNGIPPKAKYVDGCGGLMRVMPVGLLASFIPEIDAFEFACESAAITHGDPASYLSAGIWAELIVRLRRDHQDLALAVDEMKYKLIQRKIFGKYPHEKTAILQCIQAIQSVLDRLNLDGKYPDNIMDTVGLVGGNGLFTALPVFAQSLFVIMASYRHNWTADHALKVAVMQSGDSDSVASIAGNILGVMGVVHSKLTNDLKSGLNKDHKQALEQIADNFSQTLTACVAKVNALRVVNPSKMFK
jgi:ADP-ribosylglycohydrolase